MNVILDYDVGNLDSVFNGFKRVGIETVISKDPLIIQQAKSLILPGVGAFGDAMAALRSSGLIPLIMEHVKSKKYLFGICLGMQLLYEKGYEHGEHEGLGLLKGSVVHLDTELKVPHMGWNSLEFEQPKHPILKYIKPKDYVYFVHSYYVKSDHQELVAYTTYDHKIPAIVMKENIIATQFHPEKSGNVGLSILKAYGELLSMNIIPAIDLLNNQCVRLTQGDFDQVTVYSDAPEDIAFMFQSLGAKQLHIVDLDGAKSGDPINMMSIEKIIKRVDIPVQVGGGIRSLERAKMLLDLGVSRIIIGTAAIENLDLLEKLVKLYGPRIIVSIDAELGIVKTRGWKISSGIKSIDLVKTLEDIGVTSIVYTDISKDGMLEGPNFEMYETLKQKSNIGIIASGGITSYDDLKRLQSIKLEGAIVGKAYYEGKIDLKEAIRCLQEESYPV